ncbi:MAG: hypothetical protein HW405_160 [Candidatus Berkelbacteria bacterium]|nr:hypothetical protein [Candidatus Berkelbacteria bacterium]
MQNHDPQTNSQVENISKYNAGSKNPGLKLENNFFSAKRVIIILLIGIGIWILIPNIIGLKETLILLERIKYWAFILAVAAESFFYIGSTILTRTVLRMTNDKLSFYDVLKISIMDSFSVQFLPLASFGEAAVDYYFYKAKNIRTSHIILMFIARTMVIWIVFAVIYLIGAAFSPSNSGISPTKILIIWLIYFAGFALLFYLIFLYTNRNRLLAKAKKLISLANKITNLLKLKRFPESGIPGIVDKVYQATYILSQNPRLQVYSIIGALCFWFGDIFCLYFAFLGFGFHANLAIVIFAYCITRILTTISFIPGGLGVAEASLSLIFISFGIPASTALAAVLIFRLISFWIPIPVGFWSFLSLQRNSIKMKVGLVSNESN